MSLVFSGIIIFGGVYFYMAIRLPDISQLKEMGKQTPLRIYTSDQKLICEFGEKKRIPITLAQVPKQLMQAILDTEDQRFYEHHGVDFMGLLRATKAFIVSGKKAQGASTITMQVARNFFLHRKKTFLRKFDEILLAFRIDATFSKSEILELYLNKIYYGNRAYGVAAAAQVYYGKTLDELTLAQMAMLAGLPQAPSRDNPIANPEAASLRRNHVLQRMLENGHINLGAYNAAVSAPAATNYHELKTEVSAPYVAEMARNTVINKYGEAAYDAGIQVYTTIDSKLQTIANKSLHDGILAYDQRHDYRGPEGHLAPGSRVYWHHKLRNIPVISDLQPAAVINANSKTITALLNNGKVIDINADNFAWANPQLTSGDIIRVYINSKQQWQLAQLPEIEGAIVALDPKNGAILALSGGFSYAESNFNRAIQADRQTGSSFKPFVYSAALAQGFTLASVINDAPIVLTDPHTKTVWRPQNDTQTFLGPISLRTALARSRNLVSIRLLQSIGIPYTLDYLQRFGFAKSELPPTLSLALGSGTTTPLKMAAGYAAFANDGYKITPFWINSIVDANDKVIFQTHPKTVLEEEAPDAAPRIITSQNAYLITDALKSVVKTSAARKALPLQRQDLAGKTGTTNEQIDTWCVGFNGDLVTAIWLGFDQPQSTNEYGIRAVFPLWLQFMQTALANQPEHSLQQPADITAVRIDPKTGLLAAPEQEDAVFEIFTLETVPKNTAPTTLELDEVSEIPLF